MDEIKISVCIPVFKVEKYIERCARSLFEQTIDDGIEFIFVDDCSPDGSIEVLKRVLAEYPRRKAQVRIIRHERNRGLIAARHTAIGAANGEYIIHCDSDDAVDVSLYAAMLSLAVSKQLDVVVAPIKMVWPSGRQVVYESDADSVEAYFRNEYAHNGFNAMYNKLIRRSVYERTVIDIGNCRFLGEDLLQMTQLLLSCASIGFVHGTYYAYYRSEDSGTIRNEDSKNAVLQLLEVERVLAPKLLKKYPLALTYFRHVCCISVLRSRAFTANEFRMLWPEARTIAALRSDWRLAGYKKFLILLCDKSYRVGMVVVGILLCLQRMYRRIREGR